MQSQPPSVSKEEAVTVVTVRFFRMKPPTIAVSGGENIGVGKFERQLVNIYRALGKSKAAARAAKRKLAAENAAKEKKEE
jgi:hypothetical protein